MRVAPRFPGSKEAAVTLCIRCCLIGLGVRDSPLLQIPAILETLFGTTGAAGGRCGWRLRASEAPQRRTRSSRVRVSPVGHSLAKTAIQFPPQGHKNPGVLRSDSPWTDPIRLSTEAARRLRSLHTLLTGHLSHDTGAHCCARTQPYLRTSIQILHVKTCEHIMKNIKRTYPKRRKISGI